MDLLVEIFESGLEWMLAKEIKNNKPYRSILCQHLKSKFSQYEVVFDSDSCMDIVVSVQSQEVVLKECLIKDIRFFVGRCKECGQIYYQKIGKRSGLYEDSNDYRRWHVSAPYN